ncbi:hypothetical protein, partial [Pseudoalteromonas sp. S4492]|uniref:hypothetical protein n=1 Tax=Pseudoalteromonas sp. S4492 TaxID=579560 RepID=UPI001BB21D70
SLVTGGNDGILRTYDLKDPYNYNLISSLNVHRMIRAIALSENSDDLVLLRHHYRLALCDLSITDEPCQQGVRVSISPPYAGPGVAFFQND